MNTAPHISLKPVTKENFWTVVDLKLTQEQEKLIASNTLSIAESAVFDNYFPKAIYRDDTVVGFLMYDHMIADGEPNCYGIFRFMIDQRYQKQGIGRAAFKLLLDEIQQYGNAYRVIICYDPDNEIAKKLYASFGFKEIGIDEDDEMIAELILRQS